ncbi:MAG: 1,4-dihydroxy-2-naphthoate polyprenyltransferase [Actinomyces sp.]|nr:MAG: 1,4-dihydroxy-2-naphthoate polyprenyltransferase [Actinomyces sp.]
MIDRPSSVSLWVAGARPRTLPAALVPVVVGTACAAGEAGGVIWGRAVLALVVALALQVGVNYANDHADGVRGTDDARRVGPVRLVGSGLVEARRVKRAATISFTVAAVAGLVLAALVGWELLAVGAAALLAAWGYTGGPFPYGYHGLGEVFVFVFFGLVATAGTTYVQVEELTALSLVSGVAVGLWAVALLVVNNLRDIPGDTAAGKRTLAVRLGDGPTRVLYVVVLVGGFAVATVGAGLEGRAGWTALAGLPVALPALRDVVAGARGPELIGVLATTARAQLVGGLAYALGLALTA